MRREQPYMRVMTVRRGPLLALALCAFAVLAPATQASFHLTKIREIRAATTAVPFIEIQMYSAGQNLFTGHSVTTYSDTGALIDTVPLGTVPAGDNQRTILIAPGPVEGVAPDVTHILGFSNPGGAVCFENIDCVSYGAFTGTTSLSPSGTPAPGYPAMDGALSLTRKIAAGCATLLEPSDDTNNSASDFEITTPTPRNNSTSPAEAACAGGGGGDTGAPQTTITKHPKKKSEKTTAKFKFSSSEYGSSFECKLDKGAFKRCTSPRKYRHLETGKHKFQVRAADQAGNTDATPAKFGFRVVG